MSLNEGVRKRGFMKSKKPDGTKKCAGNEKAKNHFPGNQETVEYLIVDRFPVHLRSLVSALQSQQDYKRSC